MIQPVVMNWSSGKDAALALHLLRAMPEYAVTHLLTTINADAGRVFMHGIRAALLEAQAAAIGLPLIQVKLPPSPDDGLYRAAMAGALSALKNEGITTAAFGDIFLEDLKEYREAQLAGIGFTAVLPLWKMDSISLVKIIEDAGIEAVIVCVDAAKLDKEFLGRKINRQLLEDLPAGVDACGENGEFHTFVYNAPYFKEPLQIVTGETVHKQYAPSGEGAWNTGFYFLDVLLG